MLSELELLEIAVGWSRGENDRLGRFKDTFPSRYNGDGAVEQVFWSMPPKQGGVAYGSLVKQARSAGYRGPISITEEVANRRLREAAEGHITQEQERSDQEQSDQELIDELAVPSSILDGHGGKR